MSRRSPAASRPKPTPGYRLTADDGAGGLPSVRGANFEVGSGTATKLQFCRGPTSPCVPAPPTDLSAAAAFSLQPSVRVVDAAGVTVTADSSTNVAIAILPGTPTSGCMISAQGLAYRLNAISAPALTPVSSNPFDVAIFGNPTKLAFITQPPASVVVGAPFGSTVQVAIENAQNVVISQGILASVALTIDKGPNGAVLTRTGGLTVATFTGCSVSKEGTGYTLKATALQTAPVTPLTAATSKAFDAVLAPTLVTLTTAPFSGVITWGGTVLLNVGVGPQRRREGDPTPGLPRPRELVRDRGTDDERRRTGELRLPAVGQPQLPRGLRGSAGHDPGQQPDRARRGPPGEPSAAHEPRGDPDDRLRRSDHVHLDRATGTT